jgi:hypothetical protein
MQKHRSAKTNPRGAALGQNAPRNERLKIVATGRGCLDDPRNGDHTTATRLHSRGSLAGLPWIQEERVQCSTRDPEEQFQVVSARDEDVVLNTSRDIQPDIIVHQQDLRRGSPTRSTERLKLAPDSAVLANGPVDADGVISERDP